MAAPEHILVDQIESLYGDHFAWLRAWLCKRQGNRFSAEDVAQDTFLKIFRTRVDSASLREPRAFLVTVAKRLLLDQARRDMVESIYLETLRVQYENAQAESPEKLVAMMRTVERLLVALENLSSKAQQAFVSHFLGGIGQKQIALELGVSERMVRKYLAQALVCIAQATD